MPQAVPLIVKAAALADALNETFDELASDGEICTADLRQLNPMIDQVKSLTTEAELAYQWGMAVLKGGMDGKRAMELEKENAQFSDYPDAA